MSAAAGLSLVAGALYSAYYTALHIYYDYYFYSRVKGEYVAPDWQQRVKDTAFIFWLILILYIAHRLLQYATRRETSRVEKPS